MMTLVHGSLLLRSSARSSKVPYPQNKKEESTESNPEIVSLGRSCEETWGLWHQDDVQGCRIVVTLYLFSERQREK